MLAEPNTAAEHAAEDSAGRIVFWPARGGGMEIIMAYYKLNVAEVRKYCEDIYKNHGFTEEEARGITDVVLCADLYGIESHGVQRMIRYHDALKKHQVVLQPEIEVLHESPLAATLDAHQCLGHVAGTYAMKMAIKKAKEHGAGFVAHQFIVVFMGKS